jgi:hypothetical protein
MGVVLIATAMTTSNISQCIYVLYMTQNKQLYFYQRTNAFNGDATLSL